VSCQQTLYDAIMERGDHTSAEAKHAIDAAKKRVAAGENPEQVLYEEFGLEPDYILEILP